MSLAKELIDARRRLENQTKALAQSEISLKQAIENRMDALAKVLIVKVKRQKDAVAVTQAMIDEIVRVQSDVTEPVSNKRK